MKRILLSVLLLAAALRLSAQTAAWDVTFRGLTEAKNIGEYMRVLSARPHHLGSAYDKQNAEWILARFKEWGWDARIETYDVLFPTPKERVVELIEPTRFKASLEEPAVAVDPTSSQKSEQLPPFNAYSIDGDVTGPLVYVNYGRPNDYEDLERHGQHAPVQLGSLPETLHVETTRRERGDKDVLAEFDIVLQHGDFAAH